MLKTKVNEMIGRHKSIFTVLLCALFSISCASTRTPIEPPVDNGFELQINQAFSDLPNYTRIYFQNGERVIQGNLDRWSTYCRLHVYNREHKAEYLTSVSAGSIPIAHVSNQRQSSNRVYSDSGLQIASIGGIGNFRHYTTGRTHFDPPSFYLYRVKMELSSDQQPDLQTLTCSKKWATRGDYYPTLEEIRGALGDSITLQAG
ncbi:MAG: hypothetical protein AAF353_18090 [Pseudomonadota bacterium]